VGKTLYHNITQDRVNLHEADFLDMCNDSDVVFKSESGNACITKLSSSDIQKMLEDYGEEEE
jgi:hypothetical protein